MGPADRLCPAPRLCSAPIRLTAGHRGTQTPREPCSHCAQSSHLQRTSSFPHEACSPLGLRMNPGLHTDVSSDHFQPQAPCTGCRPYLECSPLPITGASWAPSSDQSAGALCLLSSQHQDLWVAFTSELVFPTGPQPTSDSSLLAEGPSRCSAYCPRDSIPRDSGFSPATSPLSALFRHTHA